jgi:hypothetical protein
MMVVPTDQAVLLGTFVSGALVAGYWVAALCFLRFWRRSGDRLFAKFAAAFALLGAQRMALTFMAEPQPTLWPYLVRLAAFLLILWAIIDKNRRK